MTTEQAMLDALKRPSVKKKVKAGTIRAMRKRLKDGEMTLTAQVAFLKEHGYFIRSEINWGKPQRKKKGDNAPTETITTADRFYSKEELAEEQEFPAPYRAPVCSICRIPFPCNCAQEQEAL